MLEKLPEEALLLEVLLEDSEQREGLRLQQGRLAELAALFSRAQSSASLPAHPELLLPWRSVPSVKLS
jgi:hypothetical protein